MKYTEICEVCAYTGDQTGACQDCGDGHDNFELESIYASAPELLEALEGLVRAIDTKKGAVCMGLHLDIARAELTKAKGG